MKQKRVKKGHPLMKRFTLPLSLCLMVSCQVPQQQSPPRPAVPQSQPAARPARKLAPVTAPAQPEVARVSYTPKPEPFGELKALPNQQIEVNFTYPDPQSFKTQAFGCGEVASASIAVTGPGIDGTLYANGSDPVTHRFAANNCQISGTVDNVPYGNVVITIKLYDVDGNELAGSELVSGFNFSEANTNVELSFRQSPVGRLLNRMRAASLNDEFLVNQLDLEALQTFFDNVTGLGGTFPNYTFANHPALLNFEAVIADLKTNNGDVSALDAQKPQYVYTPGSLNFVLNGYITGQDITASVDDVLSNDVTITSDGAVTVNNLPPGTWTLRLSGNGYIGQRLEITVTADQATDAGNLTILPPPATLTGINPTTGVSGSSAVITGTNFNTTPGNNLVKFGTTDATVTNATATELTVTVPDGLALGAQPVSLKIGAGDTVTGLDYTVVRPTITGINVSAGEIASQVIITGTNFNATPGNNTVRFGSVNATVDTASTTELTVTVPDGVFGTVPITVVNLNSPASDGSNYAIKPRITGLSVATGSSGDTLTLTGNGFDTTSGNNTIRLGSTTIAAPTANSTTELQITVPNVPAGTANAAVQVGAQTSDAVAAANFAILPRLTALSTSAGVVDSKTALIREEILTLTGTNFDPTPGNNSVSFGGTAATPLTASATQLTVRVPGNQGTPGDVSISVTTNTRDSNALTAIVPSINLNVSGGYQ